VTSSRSSSPQPSELDLDPENLSLRDLEAKGNSFYLDLGNRISFLLSFADSRRKKDLEDLEQKVRKSLLLPRIKMANDSLPPSLSLLLFFEIVYQRELQNIQNSVRNFLILRTVWFIFLLLHPWNHPILESLKKSLLIQMSFPKNLLKRTRMFFSSSNQLLGKEGKKKKKSGAKQEVTPTWIMTKLLDYFPISTYSWSSPIENGKGCLTNWKQK